MCKIGLIIIPLCILWATNVKASNNEIDAKELKDLFPNAESVNKTLEELRQKLIDGDPEAGIPSFKPLKIDKLPINLNSNLIKLNVTLNNLEIDGITDFVLTVFELAVLKLSIEVGVGLPKLTVTSNFNGKIDLLGFIPIDNEGQIELEINEITFNDKAKIGLFPIRLHDSQVIINFGQFQINLTTIINGEDISNELSELLNYLVPMIFNEEGDKIMKFISPIVEKIINDNIKLILG